jgi:hypothetical protein
MNRPVVTVTNQQTGEVIRQIPNDVVIRMAHSIDETGATCSTPKFDFLSSFLFLFFPVSI